MIDDVDVVLYVNSLINDLNEDNFFDETTDPLMDVNIFRKIATKIVTENKQKFDSLDLDELQFEKIIFETRKTVIEMTVSSLYRKELLDVVGVNESGDMIYGPSKKTKKIINKN